jgi:hypothetical protein
LGEAIGELSRGSCAYHLAQNQAQVEGSHMDQLPLENVLVFSQVGMPHVTRLVAVGEAAFHQLAAPSEQTLAVVAP